MTGSSGGRVRVRDLYRNELKRIERVEDKRREEAEFYDREAEDFLRDFREADLRQQVKDFEAEAGAPASLASVLKIRRAFQLLGDLRGRRVLEVGCGMGDVSVVLGQRGAEVLSVDVSPRMVEIARRNVALHGLSETVDVRVMSAEKLEVADESFDLIFGFVTLHHLQPTLAAQEFRRVLRPGGRAVFVDPHQGSRLLSHVRSLMPVECLESPGGGALVREDIEAVAGFFSGARVYHFELLARLERLVRSDGVVRFLYRSDACLLAWFPFLRRLSRYVVLEFTKGRTVRTPGETEETGGEDHVP